MLESILKILEGWEVDLRIILARLILGLAVLLIFYFLGKLLKRLAYKINPNSLSKYKDLQVILSAIIYYFFLLIGYYLFLRIIGLEQYVVKLLAGAGIIGIIAGFALKDIASNAFSGLLLFLEKPYKKGDWVQVDGHFGKVIKVGLLTTSVTSKTGQVVFVSNQLIYSGLFINYSVYNKRGIILRVEVEQFFDLDKLKKLVGDQIITIKIIDTNKDVKFYVNSISSNGSFSMDVFFWVMFENEELFRKTISEAIVNIKQISLDNSINIANTSWISDEDDSSSTGKYGADG